MGTLFFLNSVALGVGLAMDAFSVSIANGISNPHMPLEKRFAIAGVYAGFQFMMPMVGWICVHTVVERLQAFEKFVPWISLVLLICIGGGMVRDALRSPRVGAAEGLSELPAKLLIIQGVATSMDALSVGFTIADYGLFMAFIAALIIAAVTFLICFTGLKIGIKVGGRFSSKAEIFGGIILIFIGIEIFIRGMI